MALAGILALTVGCGDDADPAGARDTGDADGRPASPARTDPPGTEPGAVTPYVTELLIAYDRVVNQIVAEPGVADDPDDPLVQDFLSLFEEGSEVAAEMVGHWSDRADEGLRTVPYDDDHPATVSTLDGAVETVSADEVRFPLCVVSRTRVLGPDGEEQGVALPRRENRGEGEAVRTDDGWRLRDVTISSEHLTCRDQQP